MDKTKSFKRGTTKLVRNEKPMLHYPHRHSMDPDNHFFKVEETDFPSLSEVRDESSKTEKDSSTCSISSFTYSSKLKTLPAECLSPNVKFENVQHGRGPSRKESTLNKPDKSRHLNELPLSVQSSHQSFNKHSSNVNIQKSTANKKIADSQLNSSFSGVKCKNEAPNMKQTYGQKSACGNRSIKNSHSESSTNAHLFKNDPSDHAFGNIQKSTIRKSLSSPRKPDTKHSPPLLTYNKESDKPNINPQYKRHDDTNRSLSSSEESQQHVGLLPINVKQIGSGVSKNSSNVARLATSSGGRIAYNSVKIEKNNSLNQSLNVQSSIAGAGETKKKKKRKSKLKRQAALQSGKILFLTPEVHSKIVNQSNDVNVKKNQNIFTNINDNEEYPELGAAKPRTLKESHEAVTNILIKKEQSSESTAFAPKTDNAKEMLISKDFSTNNNQEVATKSEGKNVGPFEKAEAEKPIIHSNNPITLSLFDMLATAKSKKKDPERKEESTDDGNFVKVFKKETFKKNAYQAVNPLAASKPTIKRGKEREKPKIKRPSRMRKLILMERQLRKENMKRQEDDGEKQRKSDDIFDELKTCINEFSATDNLESSVESFQNESVNEASGCIIPINLDLSKDVSEHFVLNCNHADPESELKGQINVCENSALDNELINEANHHVKNHIIVVGNTASELISESTTIFNVEKDLIFNPISTYDKNLVDIDTIEYTTGISCLNSGNAGQKHSDFENIVSDTSCIEGNLVKNCEKTENYCQINNFINELKEPVYKAADMKENIVPTESNANSNSEFYLKTTDVIESKKSIGNLDLSEKMNSNITVNSFSDAERLKATKIMLHSRKFRQYCNHFISKEIDQAVFSLIDDLARFQDRMYQKDPVKAKIRRRLVYGIKEIKKHMKLKKVKCIIIATDIEDVKIEGGLNDSLKELISLAEAYQIPCVFSHWRFNLGKVCRKSVPVSCVGIFNYEGSEKNFKKMVELHEDSKHDYIEVTKKLASELTDDQLQELFEAEKVSALFLREASQKILRKMFHFTPKDYRNNPTSVEKYAITEAEDSVAESSKCSSIFDVDENSFIENDAEVLKKLNKDGNLLHPNETGINILLVKYKVVKEC